MFSVILTTYNRQASIERALNSLINQTYASFEVIIVDDGSNDNSFMIINAYLKNNNNFRYLYEDNQGAGAAKNLGIQAARGKYITFLDSDDEYLNEHLTIRYSILKQYPEIDFLHGGYKIIGDSYVPDIHNKEQKIHLDYCVVGGTFVFKRDIVNKLNGYPKLRFGDDTQFYNLVQQGNYIIKKIPNQTYVYHRNSIDSICNNLK